MEVEDYWIEETAEQNAIDENNEERVEDICEISQKSASQQISNLPKPSPKPLVPVVLSSANHQGSGRKINVRFVKDTNHVNFAKSIDPPAPLTSVPRKVAFLGCGSRSGFIVPSRFEYSPATGPATPCSSKGSNPSIVTGTRCSPHDSPDSVVSSSHGNLGVNFVEVIDPPEPLTSTPRKVARSESPPVVQTVVVPCPSKETDADIFAGAKTGTHCSPHNSPDSADSSAAENLAGSHSADGQVSDETKTATNFSVAECSNHHFTPTTLTRLLESTKTGQLILESRSLGKLTDDSQADIVAIIADYHNQKGLEATQQIVEEYATSIVTLFKGELKVN